MKEYKLTMPECRKIAKRVFAWFNDLDPYGYPDIDREEIVSVTAWSIRNDPKKAAFNIGLAILNFMTDNGVKKGSAIFESGNELVNYIDTECYVLTMFSASERKDFRERRAS